MCAIAASRLRGKPAPKPLSASPFDSSCKRLTVVYSSPEGTWAYVKGAPEVIFERSALDEQQRADLRTVAGELGPQRLARPGRRRARAAERGLLDDEEFETELDVLGLVGLHDPPRDAARGAIAEAHAAGLRVEMLTGDHPLTAAAIGRSLGLPAEVVHARVTEEKLRLVERRQAEGEVVAVTGDGVNDAPALRRADVGVRWAAGGTEAREASDLVLTNDDFATIIAAIWEGRAITDNIRKFVAFLLSANLGEVALRRGDPGRTRHPYDRRPGAARERPDRRTSGRRSQEIPSPATMRRPPERSAHLFPRLD